MKLQKGIVLGEGHKLALAVGLVVLSGAYADGLTPMYGKTSGQNSGGLDKIVTWYSDEACTSTEGVITPWQVGSNTCRYAILSAAKFSNSTFPDVPACFGTDGVTIGSSVHNRQSYNFNGNVTVHFPQLTIYSGYFQANSESVKGTKLTGNCTFVKTTSTIQFAPVNINTGGARGWDLAGTYTAASDIDIRLSMTFSSASDGSGIGFLALTGDFSSFKGRFRMIETVPNMGDNVGYFECRLQSPTALGDTSYPRTDAVTLKHRAHLVMTDDVVQDGTRGITLDLSSGQFACLNAAAGKQWTLKAPLYGSTGTLKKVGAGTVVLAGPVEVEDIVVTNGTLVVAPGATFPANGHITVKAGATLLSRVGTHLPVAYTLEEGGRFAFDFTVPYENGTTTALDCSDMTPADYGLLTKPIEVALSGKIPLPVNTTQELACVRFPSGLVQTTDFTNLTEKTDFGLPNTWLKVVPDTDAGEDVLTLVVKPAIVRTGGDVYRPLTHQYTYSRTTSAYTETPVWSDGLAAHPGADYIHTNGCEIWSWDAHDNHTREFPGDSLYLTSQFSMKSSCLIIPNLTLAGGYFADVAGSPTLHRYAGGPFTLNSAITFSGASDKGTRYSYSIEAELLGKGDLTLTSATNAGVVVYVTGTNRNYKGKVTVTNAKTPTGPAQGTVVSIASPHSLGGALPSAAWNGVALGKYSLIRPQTTMTLEAENRGIGISTSGGGFDVPEGVVLTVKQRVRLNPNSSCVLYKEGAGTLVIAGEVRHGYAGTNLVDGTNNRMQVDAGFLRAEGTNSYSTLRIAFADGTGVEVDPEATGDVKTFGLCTLRNFAPLEAGGKVLVKPVPTFDIEDKPLFSAAVCTVPASHADLTDTLMPANIHGYTGRIKKDSETYASEGLVTYTATWTKTGFTVIFR